MAQDSFFFNAPAKCQRQLVTVDDVQNQMTAFNLMYEIGPNGSVNSCNNPDFEAQWRKAIREGVINCSGTPIELDFFEKIAGGRTTDIDATNLYIKSNCDIDMNIYAEAAILGNAPGAATTFTMARSQHAANGKFTNVTEGGALYIYEDDAWAYIRTVDRTVDYAHTVTVVPFKGAYTIKIRAGKPMFFNAARIVGGSSTPVPSSNWITNGYISKVMPWRIRKDFDLKVQLDKAYQEVLQFAIIFDQNGNQLDSFQYKEMIEMRKDLKIRRNLNAFIGQKIDNPALIGADVDDKFPGFEGYEPTVRYAGGIVYPYGKTTGFSLNSDMTNILLRQDARKKSMEFMVLNGLPFHLNLVNRANIDFDRNPGACTFESFQRSGADAEEIKKLGVKSYAFAGFTMHFKNMDALSDQRMIGHGNFPYKAYMMPTMGLTDSLGRSVPPIEFFVPKGWRYEEYIRDQRKITGYEIMSGYAVDVEMMAVHCPDSHIIIDPRNY